MCTSVDSSTSFSVFWNPIPNPIDENGVITHYTVEYISVFSSDIATVPADELSVEVTGLEEFTQYTIRVAAATSVGVGPYSFPMRHRLFQKSLFFKIYISTTAFIISTSEFVPDGDLYRGYADTPILRACAA